MRIQHDVQIQTFEIKVKALNEKIEQKTDTLLRVQRERFREKLKTTKLNEMIIELQKSRYISGENVRNVN